MKVFRSLALLGLSSVLLVSALALAGCESGLFGPSAYEKKLHTKALPHINELEKPAGLPVELVKDGKLQFVVVMNHPGRFISNQAHGAWRLLEEGFFRTTGEKPVLMDAVKDRAKWEKSPYVILLGDSAAAREFGFDTDQLKDQELMVSTFEKKVGGESRSTKDVNSSLQLQLETPTQAIRGLAILGNEKTIVGLPPQGKIDARGRSDALSYSVADFLERFMDVRYYFPGEYGYYFPKTANLTVEPVAYRSAPHFNTRGNPYAFYCAMNTDEKKKAWAGQLGENPGGVDIKTRWRLGMTMELLGKHAPDPRSVAAAYPDRIKDLFYTSPNGHLWYSKTNYFANYFDVFNLEKGGFADALMETWKKYYESDGKERSCNMATLIGQEWINFGVTDVYLNPQDCMDDPIVIREKLLQKEDFERASTVDGRTLLANVYGRFYCHLCDRLAKELPGKKLFILAYYNCKYAPTRYKFPANFDCIVCDGSLLSYCMDPRARAKSQALFKGWYDAMGGRAPGMAYLYGCGHPFGHAITAEYIGECVKLLGPSLGRTGVFHDGGITWNRFYAYYIGAHQQWDPDLDAVAVFDDMADKMLGKAAAPMKRFHNKLRANCEKYIMPTLFDSKLVYPLAEVDALEALLAEAQAAVTPGSIEEKRLKVIAGGWDKSFADYRKKQANAQAKPNGLYRVARRTGETVDWSKIPSVPGSNGLKLVWDERGLYGRADGEVHYELTTPQVKDAETVKLDYDTMVPGFNLSFTPKFRQTTYCAIEMKPFGRLKLLGAGDDPNFDETKGPAFFGDTTGEVRTAVTEKGNRYTISNARAAYTNSNGPLPGPREHVRDFHFGTLAGHESGFFCYANWFHMMVNGFRFGDADLGVGNMKLYEKGAEKGVEYALNYDGAKVALRFFMKPDSSFLWGELEQIEVKGDEMVKGKGEGEGWSTRPVTNAVITLNSIPSFLIRDAKKAPFPYRRQIRTATRLMENPPDSKKGCITFPIEPSDKFFFSQDANYDGTSDDRGKGPCIMYIDLDKVASGTVSAYHDHRDIGLTVNLKMPLKKVRFAIWEERYRRHANEETYRKFLKEGMGF